MYVRVCVYIFEGSLSCWNEASRNYITDGNGNQRKTCSYSGDTFGASL